MVFYYENTLYSDFIPGKQNSLRSMEDSFSKLLEVVNRFRAQTVKPYDGKLWQWMDCIGVST